VGVQEILFVGQEGKKKLLDEDILGAKEKEKEKEEIRFVEQD
jgi:hypothetical protein